MAEIDARPEDTLKHQRLGRISYRAWRRGFREADMVLGPFTDQVGPTLSHEELDQLETLLDEEDQYLYAWIIEKEPTPPEFDGPMLARIRAFMREHVAAEVAKGIG
ncbi:Flavinator of succinate dehydrogenase [compost metagenome]